MSSQNLRVVVQMGSPSVSRLITILGTMDIRRVAPLVLAVALASCSSQAPGTGGAPGTSGTPGSPAPSDRKYLLDRVGDAAIVQLYADGFSSLPLKQKTLIWHL